jgi:uncharacterized protein (TIGR02231 family)
MKKSLVTFVFSVFAVVLFAQENEGQKVKTKPEKVTLFVRGAQVDSKGNSPLKVGTQTIIFDNLSNFIDPNSVQVKVNADITILSVNYQLNYLEPQNNPEYKRLEDSVKICKKEIARVALTKNSFQEELTMLAANKSIGGANNGVSVSEFEKMANFIRTRIADVSLKRLESEEKETKLRERQTQLEQQMYTLKNSGAQPSGEIVVTAISKEVGNANFELSYFVSNCGWTPGYDVRVKDVNTPANIVAKANVYQTTGMDWKNIQLSLSTGNPTQGNTKPILNPWTLYLTDRTVYKEKTKYRYKSTTNSDYSGAAPAAMEKDMMSKRMDEVVVTNSWSNTAASNTGVGTSTTNAIFDIKLPYTILSNGKVNIVEIQEYTVAANYSYFAAPKIDKDAFLVADLIGWDKNELLPGDANVYFENNYVGKTYFDSRIVDDTLSFALGRDNNVRIQRKQVKDLKEKVNIAGSINKLNREFEIEIKNTRKSSIVLEMEDQIPLTSNAELTIEKTGAEGAAFDSKTGKLTWKLTLNPGESKKLAFGYTLKYPKKYNLNGL